MPHAIRDEEPQLRFHRTKRNAHLSQDLWSLRLLFKNIRHDYLESDTVLSIRSLLRSKIQSTARKTTLSSASSTTTRIVSLGLGSFRSSDRGRRLKQLAILLDIKEQIEHDEKRTIDIYAQDPSFDAVDEAFLEDLGIKILHTPSPTELGEATDYINGSTLVFSPFLTLEAYELLFSARQVSHFIGDDFDALRVKWPKHSSSRDEVEALRRRFVVDFSKRKVARDDHFWAADRPFPMAFYTTSA